MKIDLFLQILKNTFRYTETQPENCMSFVKSVIFLRWAHAFKSRGRGVENVKEGRNRTNKEVLRQAFRVKFLTKTKIVIIYPSTTGKPSKLAIY